jgi:hypothetical protein
VIPLLVDENFNDRIIKGVARLQPGIDLVRVRDIGLSAAPDPVILERAAALDAPS